MPKYFTKLDQPYAHCSSHDYHETYTYNDDHAYQHYKHSHDYPNNVGYHSDFPDEHPENSTTVKEPIKEMHKKGSPEHYSSYYICHSKDQSEKELHKNYIRIWPCDW